MNFRHYGAKDGLAQNSVFAITQDSTGFIWLGTRYGLNKFDGYHFKTFRNDSNDSTTLSNNDIRALCYDQKSKTLWVGSMHGLNAYNENTNSFTHYFPLENDSSSLSHYEIHCIYLDRDNNLWVGTLNGLNLYDRESNAFIRILSNRKNGTGPSNNNISEVFEDHKGNLWVGTKNGLNRLDSRQGNLFYFECFFHDSMTPNSLSHNEIKAIEEDASGNLWVGTSNGLNQLDITTEVFTRFYHDINDPNSLTENNIGDIGIDGEGNIWVGTIRGLNLYRASDQSFQRILNKGQTEKGLSNNAIITIFKDCENSMWLGTFRGGVNFWSRFIDQFPYYQYNAYANSISESAVNAFWENEKGNLWIGTNGGGLNYFDRETQRFSIFQAFSDKQIKTILGDPKGNLWLGTYDKGLLLLNPLTNNLQYFTKEDTNGLSNNNVYTLDQNKDKLFIGTYGGGINILNLKNNEFDYFRHDPKDSRSLSSNFVRKLYRDSKDQLWIGTERGLNLLDTLEEKIVFQHLLQETNIYCIYEDRRRILWVGTYGEGLIGIDQNTGETFHYAVKEGLPGNIVFGILEDDEGHLWLSTNAGICNFDYTTSIFYNYNLADGLKDLEFFYNAYYKTQKGELLFGGANGFTLFHPEDVIRNTDRPSIIFTDLKVFGKAVEINDESGLLNNSLNETESLTFKHDQAIFSIGFSALNFISPEKNLYAYRLEGLEEKWNYTIGAASATYTIQDYGTYTLEVKATNNDGIWNETARKLIIKVLPAPWRSWWAYFIYSILLVLALIMLIRFTKTRTQLYHKLELEQLEKHKQEELHQMKLRFFTNITHEFRTPLTLILSPLEMLQTRYEEDFYLQKQLQTVQRSTQRLLNLVNQLLTFRKLESEHLQLNLQKDDLVTYLKGIYQTFQSYAEQRNITYIFQSNVKIVSLNFDHDKLEKVIYNLLSNAFKFTKDAGRIELHIGQRDEYVEIKVKDNGRGIEKKHLDKIFMRFYEGEHDTKALIKSTGIGLAISRQLIQLHKGNITVESKLGEGTVFTVLLPIDTPESNRNLTKDNNVNTMLLPPKLIDDEFLSRHDIKVDLSSIQKPHTDLPDENAPLILIVEDNDEIRQHICSIFSDEYRLLDVEDAYKGLELAKEKLPNLIISDVMMPGMDGIQLCGRVKQDLHTSHIPILLLTARTSQISKIEGFEVGADDYITKPFHPKELKVRVRNLIESRKRLSEQFTKIVNLEPKEVTLTSADEQFLKRAMEVIEENIDRTRFTMEDFAEEMAVSRALLFNKLKALTDQTPNKFMQTTRLKRAAQLLKQEKLTVSEVAYSVGFKDPKYFSKCFQKQYGRTPSNYAIRKL